MSRGCVAIVGLAVVAVFWIAPQEVAAQNREWQLKASYMYYFAQFVEWPEDRSEGDFVIGVLGNNPFGAYTRTLEGLRASGDRRIVVRSIASLDDLDPDDPCHILFVSRLGITAEETRRRVAAASERLRDDHVLIVADTPDAAGADRAAFNFYVANNRMRLQYSSRAVASAGLAVQNRLTSLESIVPVQR